MSDCFGNQANVVACRLAEDGGVTPDFLNLLTQFVTKARQAAAEFAAKTVTQNNFAATDLSAKDSLSVVDLSVKDSQAALELASKILAKDSHAALELAAKILANAREAAAKLRA
jgi:hypothetical protein